MNKYLNIKFEAPTTDAGGGTQPPATAQSGGAAPVPPAASPAPNASNNTPPAANDWMAALPPELKGYAEIKGFKDPNMVVDAYQQLEKLRGVPLERLMQLPEKPDAPEWEKVYQRLGKPEKAESYNFQFDKDQAVDKSFVDFAKNTFHKANLSGKQAEFIMQELNSYAKNGLASEKAELAAKGEQSQNELKTKWGNAYEQNHNIAKRGAAEFGVTVEAIDAMEQAIGTVATMEFFHKIGSKLGEAQFTTGDGKSQFGRMSPEAAKAALAENLKSAEFRSKVLVAGTNEYKTYTELMKDAHPGMTSV